MLWVSWRRWPDVFVDFGWQLYVPWQLAAGRVLYTDVAYFNGPLSPYWNSLWFRLFGPGLMTLVAVNGALLAVLLVLVYRLLVAIAGRVAATTGCVVFLLLFALGQFKAIGNYNFLCPYVHELTHGTLLSLAAVALLWRYQCRRGLGAVAAAGLCIGLLALTKAEVFVAGALATVAGGTLALWVERPGRARLVTVLGVFAAGVVLPLLVAFWLLSSRLPATQALHGLLQPFSSVVNPEARSLKFYTDVMGVTHPWESVQRLLWWLGGYAAVLVPAAAAGFFAGRLARSGTGVTVMVGGVVAVVLWALRDSLDWVQVGRPLPVLLVIVLAATSVELVRVRHEPVHAAPLVVRFSLCVLGAALLAKLALNVRIDRYGFALAMPGTLMVVAALVDWIPAAITRRGGDGRVFCSAAFAAVGVVTAIFVRTACEAYAAKTFVVGSGVDRFYSTEARGMFAAAALDEINRRVAPEQTVAVLPEGVMLNYLARRAASTPYVVFMPLDVVVFQEARILHAFQQHPPDFVLLVHKDTSEFGYTYFGRDYGQSLFSWVMENYHAVWRIGAVPLREHQFGIVMLERGAGPAVNHAE
jgi:hypothetical protein